MEQHNGGDPRGEWLKEFEKMSDGQPVKHNLKRPEEPKYEYDEPEPKQKDGKNLFLVLMIVLTAVLLIGIGVILFFVLKRCDKPVPNDPIAAETTAPETEPPKQLDELTEAPHEVVDRFVKWYLGDKFDSYDFTETHSLSEEKVLDEVTVDLNAVLNGKTYHSVMDAVFVYNRETKSWRVATYTATPLKADDGSEPGDQSKTPEPTAAPTQAPTPTPKATEGPLPDSFKFGGVTVKKGQTEIIGSDKVNGKTIDGDDKGNFTHITKEEVEMLVKMCPKLKKLNLNYCWFDTYEPLSELKYLEFLELKSCGTAKGGKKMTDIGWVRNLKKLKHLNLCHNAIKDISPIEELTALTWINLGDNKLTDESLEIIAKLTNLKSLYLYKQSSITDVTPLKTLNALVKLNLGNNKKLKTLEPLASLKSLENLIIYSTGVEDISYLPKFKKLKEVDLAGCALKYKQYYTYLPKCPKLTKFIIAKTDEDGVKAGKQFKKEGIKITYDFR